VLVLSRKFSEKVFIGHDIRITVVDIGCGKIRLGVEAPRNVPVYRQEPPPADDDHRSGVGGPGRPGPPRRPQRPGLPCAGPRGRELAMPDRLGEAELLRRLDGCPATGTFWRHYRTGGVYRVVGRAMLAATLEPLVIYRHVESGLTFARPLAEWLETVECEGRAAERFTPVGEQP
jgi:carbon storage regulator